MRNDGLRAGGRKETVKRVSCTVSKSVFKIRTPNIQQVAKVLLFSKRLTNIAKFYQIFYIS